MLSCKNCLKSFIPKCKWRTQIYCSLQCSANNQKNRKIKICQWCKNSYEIPISADKNINRSKFCSAPCRRLHVQKLLTKNKHTPCEICKKVFVQKPSHKQKFCSMTCYRIYQKSPQWKKELSFSGKGKLNRFRNKTHFCIRCKSKNNVQIHHQNGNNQDHSLSNLIPLCQTCHGHLHHLYNSSKKSLKHFTQTFIKLGIH